MGVWKNERSPSLKYGVYLIIWTLGCKFDGKNLANGHMQFIDYTIMQLVPTTLDIQRQYYMRLNEARALLH